MDLKNNPHYQNGKLIGSQVVRHIESTTYGDIETALESKQELVKDLKEQFGWDETTKDVAETLGIIEMLKQEVKRKEKEEEESKHNLTDEDVINIANNIGVDITQNQVTNILDRYLEAQESDPGATWNLVIENLIHESNNE